MLFYHIPILAAYLLSLLYINLQKFSQAKKKNNKVIEYFRNGHLYLSIFPKYQRSFVKKVNLLHNAAKTVFWVIKVTA